MDHKKINYLRLLELSIIFVLIISMRSMSGGTWDGKVYRAPPIIDEEISTFQSSFMNTNSKFRVRLSDESTLEFFDSANFTLYLVLIGSNTTKVYQQGEFEKSYSCNVIPSTYYIEIDFVNLTQDIELTFSHYGISIRLIVTFVTVGIFGCALIGRGVLKRYLIK